MTFYGTDELQRDSAADVSADVPATGVEPPGWTSGLLESSAFLVPSWTARPKMMPFDFFFDLGVFRDSEGRFSARPDEDGQLGEGCGVEGGG